MILFHHQFELFKEWEGLGEKGKEGTYAPQFFKKDYFFQKLATFSTKMFVNIVWSEKVNFFALKRPRHATVHTTAHKFVSNTFVKWGVHVTD